LSSNNERLIQVLKQLSTAFISKQPVPPATTLAHGAEGESPSELTLLTMAIALLENWLIS